VDDHGIPSGLSLLRLRVFAAVAEHGGYSAAARHLMLSQPTVSFHVQALERGFGTKLLAYRGRRVHLTPAGEALYALASRTLRDAEAMTAQMASLRAGRAGRVRLAASIAFEQAFFFRTVIAPFTRAHPGIELSLRFGTSRQMVEAVRSGDADLGYVMHHHMPAETRYLPLHTSHVAFYISAGHGLTERSRPTAEEVAEAGLITAPLDSAEWEYYGNALRGNGLRRYRVALEVSGIQARVLAAQAGLGVLVVFLPRYAGQVTLPGLTAIPVAGDQPGGPEFGLVERAPEPVMRPVAALAEWLRQVTTRREGRSQDKGDQHFG
jgi:DNA-binding transcriptional LysR family regulator